jgi:hypothetical protein
MGDGVCYVNYAALELVVGLRQVLSRDSGVREHPRKCSRRFLSDLWLIVLRDRGLHDHQVS